MIATYEALDRFGRMLTDAGFAAGRPDPLIALRVFKAFAAVPVDCADDALLFHAGTFSFTGRSLFQLGFTRQFTHEEDGEYAGMEHLHCTVYYAPTPALRTCEATLWSYDCPSRDEFFARVEAMPEFRIPARGHVPLRAAMEQENV